MEENKTPPPTKKKVAPKKKKPSKRTASKKVDYSMKTPPEQSPYEKLTPLQWQAIWHLLGGMSIQEVSKKLNIPEHTIYNWRSRDDSTCVNFREAMAMEIKARNEQAREEGKAIIDDAYQVLRDWMTYLKKQKGRLDPKHVSNVMAILNSSKYLFKDKTEDDDDKKKKDLLTAFEQFIKEEITNAQINSGE